MSSQKTCGSPKMTDAEIIRAVFPRHTMKRLASLMGAPLDTARHWLYRNFSAARRQELALRLLDHLDDEDRRRAAIRQHLCRMVGEYGEMDGTRGSLARGEIRRTPARAKVG